VSEHLIFGLTCPDCGKTDSHINAGNSVQFVSHVEYIEDRKKKGWTVVLDPIPKPPLCPQCTARAS